ncbi:MAG: hypothetical protein PHS54_01570 [Clostridia bacterium]|nr:hypothetical protein [Clostridia bacterium]
MIFSDTSGYQGIVQDIDFILFGSSTATSSYAIADKTRNINSWYDKAASIIIKSDDRWEWDDNNQTGLPIGTNDLVANQQDYEISGADFLKILKVEIKDSSGNWNPLTPISLDDKRSVSMTDYKKTAGTPDEYDKFGNSIFLYPKPSSTITDGLKVFYQRNVSHFTTADTTKVPGFAEMFHKYLSYGAALDYAIAHTMNNKINILVPLIQQMENDIREYYSTRNDKDDIPRMSLQKENYGFESEYGCIFKR